MEPKNRIRIGFVPSYRGDWGSISPWCIKMRKEAIAAFEQVKNLEAITPQACPEDPAAVDAGKGYAPGGAVSSLEQAHAIGLYFQRQQVDGLIICALNFGDERSSAKIAEMLKVPVLLYATREPEVPEGPSLGRVSDSYCGTLSIASALYRRKIPFQYAGIFYAEEPEFLLEIERFVRATAVVKAMRGAQIGQVGLRPEGFETVGYDEVAMIQKFGQNVIHRDLSEIVIEAQSYKNDDPMVLEKMQAIRGEVAKVTVADDWLSNAAKMELTLSKFWQRSNLSALGMTCWPAIQRLIGGSVCALFGRMTGQGMLTACETDIIGALSMLVSYSAALNETVPHFIDWTIQHRHDPNRFLAWHCGNAPVCLAADPTRTALRSRQDMVGELPIREANEQAGLYQFQLKPGKVTLCRLAEYDNEWKMLITSGEIIPSEEELAGTWAWVELKDHQKLYRTLVEEGFIHHASMIHGDQVKALQQACKFLDIQPVLVE